MLSFQLRPKLGARAAGGPLVAPCTHLSPRIEAVTYRGALERSRHPRRRPVHHVPRIPLSRRHRRQPPNAVRSTGHSSAALSVLTATPTKLASGCSPHGNRSRRSPRLSIAIAPAATLLEPHHARLRPRRPPRPSPRVPLDFALEKWCAGHAPEPGCSSIRRAQSSTTRRDSPRDPQPPQRGSLRGARRAPGSRYRIPPGRAAYGWGRTHLRALPPSHALYCSIHESRGSFSA